MVIMVAMMHALAIVKLPLRPYLVPLNHSEINPMYPSSMHVPAGCFPDARLYSQSIITCCLSLPLTVLKDNPTFDSAGWSAVELNLYGCSLILLSRRGDYVHQQLSPDVGQRADCPSWSNFEISDFSFNSPLAVELLYSDLESGSELY